MNELEFKEALKKINISLTDSQMKQFELYCDTLFYYNEFINLTAIKTKEDVYLKHFYDSLTVTMIHDFNQEEKIIDIGTGAGFPGLVLAICFPKASITLLDSNNKKINFLNYLIDLLKLTNVETVVARSEDYAKLHREEYDLVVSRAVANLQILLEISFPLIKLRGSFIAMKANLKEELEDSEETIEKLMGIQKQLKIFNLPNDAGKRTLVEIEKKRRTPLLYPRSYAIIVKKALKKKSK